MFGAEDSKPDFYAIVSNLRFVGDEIVPGEQLTDVPSDVPPSAPTNLNITSWRIYQKHMSYWLLVMQSQHLKIDHISIFYEGLTICL